MISLPDEYHQEPDQQELFSTEQAKKKQVAATYAAWDLALNI